MRMNFFRPFFWASLSALLLAFPVLAKAGSLNGKSANTAPSIVLVDERHGGHERHEDRGRWDRDRGSRWGYGYRDRDHDRRWRNRRDWDDNYYYRYPYRNGYGYGYYPYYNYNPYGYGYPYNYPYGRNRFFLRIW